MHTWHIHLALKRKQPSGELAALFSARFRTSSGTTCQGELNSVLTLAIEWQSMTSRCHDRIFFSSKQTVLSNMADASVM